MVYALFVDDDVALTESAKSLATQAGLDLLVASTWEEGVAAFHAHSPDLIISDYNLPGSELGLRLLIKLSRLRPSVRLVLISAYLQEDDVKSVMDLGLVDRAVRKLSTMDTASAILEEVADAKSRAEQPTNWSAFAANASRVRNVDQGSLDELDKLLQARI